MSSRLEFFYDYVSPYSYLANTQVAKRFPEAVHRPFLLGAAMKAVGNRPPLTVPAKFAYLERDMARWVSHYGIRFVMNPLFPQNTVKALRLALVAQEAGQFAGLHNDLFEAMWIHGQDLSSPELLASLASRNDLPADALVRIETTGIKDSLRRNTDEAVARGAFGAPTFFVGEEMFFGNDRFEFIAEALAD